MLMSDLPNSRDAEIVSGLFGRLIHLLNRVLDCIDKKDVEGRFRATDAALEIVCLLYEGLDPAGADTWTEQTRSVYLHVIKALAMVNVRQDRLMAEGVMELVLPLRDAWANLSAQARLVESASTFATVSAAVEPDNRNHMRI